MAQDPQFLIRSASTLLSIIDQQIAQPEESSNKRSVRLLDHIALLFVTQAKEDVSAVSAVLSGGSSILIRCTDSNCDELARNSATVNDSAATNRRVIGDDAGPDESNSERLNDPEVRDEDMLAALLARYVFPSYYSPYSRFD